MRDFGLGQGMGSPSSGRKASAHRQEQKNLISYLIQMSLTGRYRVSQPLRDFKMMKLEKA